MVTVFEFWRRARQSREWTRKGNSGKNIICVNSRPDLFRLSFVSIRVHSWLVPVRREGGDDLFEARVAAQRIPPRHQFQLTIGKGTGVANGAGKLLTGHGIVANPGRDDRKISDHDAPH